MSSGLAVDIPSYTLMTVCQSTFGKLFLRHCMELGVLAAWLPEAHHKESQG
jgi:hypothetical protein